MSDARIFEDALIALQAKAPVTLISSIGELAQAHARELAAARLEYLKPREHGTCTFAMIGKLKCPGELCDENGNCETHAEAYKALYSDLAAARAETWREALRLAIANPKRSHLELGAIFKQRAVEVHEDRHE